MATTATLAGFNSSPPDSPTIADVPRKSTERDRVAATGMAAAAVLSIVLVALDPEVSVHGAGPILQAIAASAPFHQGVHVAESLFVLMLAHGVVSLGARLGLSRPVVRFGLMAYLAGALTMLVAATFDGFVTPAIAAAWLRPNHDVQAGLEAVRFAGAAVQSFATMSWGLEAMGALALSAALFADGGARRRLGALGLVAAAAPIVTIAASGPAMDTMVVVAILLTQAVWNVVCAIALWRRDRA
jgi:hypothetical protein